jgi:predicted metal-dependent hydrolase
MGEIRIVGDNRSIVGDGYAYHNKITLETAQKMIDSICMHLGFEEVCVQLGYKNTKNKYGEFRLATKEMVVKKKELSEGLVLHELAHYSSGLHGEEFKTMQRLLYRVWYGLRSCFYANTKS